MGGCMCGKCSKCSGWLLLAVAAGFLLQDLGSWSFFGLNWWTVVALFMALKTVGKMSCKDCQALCSPKKK